MHWKNHVKRCLSIEGKKMWKQSQMGEYLQKAGNGAKHGVDQ